MENKEGWEGLAMQKQAAGQTIGLSQVCIWSVSFYLLSSSHIFQCKGYPLYHMNERDSTKLQIMLATGTCSQATTGLQAWYWRDFRSRTANSKVHMSIRWDASKHKVKLTRQDWRFGDWILQGKQVRVLSIQVPDRGGLTLERPEVWARTSVDMRSVSKAQP